MPKMYFGSRGGVYYKKNGRKVYVKQKQLNNPGGYTDFGNPLAMLAAKKMGSKVLNEKSILKFLKKNPKIMKGICEELCGQSSFGYNQFGYYTHFGGYNYFGVTTDQEFKQDMLNNIDETDIKYIKEDLESFYKNDINEINDTLNWLKVQLKKYPELVKKVEAVEKLFNKPKSSSSRRSSSSARFTDLASKIGEGVNFQPVRFVGKVYEDDPKKFIDDFFKVLGWNFISVKLKGEHEKDIKKWIKEKVETLYNQPFSNPGTYNKIKTYIQQKIALSETNMDELYNALFNPYSEDPEAAARAQAAEEASREASKDFVKLMEKIPRSMKKYFPYKIAIQSGVNGEHVKDKYMTEQNDPDLIKLVEDVDKLKIKQSPKEQEQTIIESRRPATDDDIINLFTRCSEENDFSALASLNPKILDALSNWVETNCSKKGKCDKKQKGIIKLLKGWAGGRRTSRLSQVLPQLRRRPTKSSLPSINENPSFGYHSNFGYYY